MRRMRSPLWLTPVLWITTCAPHDPPPVDATVADAPVDVPTDVPHYDHAYIDPWQCDGASAALPLDEALDGTQTRAGQVTRPEELIGGEGAYGRVGHFKLYNNRVRFIV